MKGYVLKIVALIVFSVGVFTSKAQDTLHLNFHHTQVTVHDSLQKRIDAWVKSLNGQHVNISVYGYYHRAEFKKFAQQRCDEMFLVLNRKARSLITIDFIGTKKGEDYQRTRVDIVYSGSGSAVKAAADKAAAEVAEKEKAAMEKAEQKAKETAEKEKKELEEKEKKKVAESEKKSEEGKKKSEEGKKKAEEHKEQAQENKEKAEENAKEEVKKTEEVVEEAKTTTTESTDDSHLTEKEKKMKAALEKKAKKKD